MTATKAISLLIPSDNTILMRDLQNSIRANCPQSRMSLSKSTDNFWYMEVAGGPSRGETWRAVRHIVSEVERQHHGGRVVEIIR
jgi:hypothetical protein